MNLPNQISNLFELMNGNRNKISDLEETVEKLMREKSTQNQLFQDRIEEIERNFKNQLRRLKLKQTQLEKDINQNKNQ